MARLVIISNRLPVTVNRSAGEFNFFPSAGGLATGLNSLNTDSQKRLWIGWPGEVITSEYEQESIRRNLSPDGLIPVFLSQKEIERFYEGFSNKVIWPHFHYFNQFTVYDDALWDAYQAVNRKFAKIALDILEPEDYIWIQDYQLMLLPAMIREAVPEACIGFFLHIPFPSYEVFRVLPWRKQLLHGVLGADLIGFHTFDYMRHFLSAVYRISGFEHHLGKLKVNKRQITVEVFPMGIDFEKFANPSFWLNDNDSAAAIRAMGKNRQVVLSIDRLDYTKGLPQRLKAYRKFLEANVDLCNKVTFVMVVVPSRVNLEQYQGLKSEIETMVGEINGNFGSFQWMPIQYFYRALTFEELTTLYQVADVAMITPLRDGMNLVAKEYVASKVQSQKGVLVLSEMAGAANELTDAILVNPLDENDVAGKLSDALRMHPKEQAFRLEKMQEHLQKFDVRQWAGSFISELKKTMEVNQSSQVRIMSEEVKALIKEQYRQAGRRLIMLDYDGTLMPFHVDPKAVFPDAGLLQILRSFTDSDQNQLVINSGRDRQTLENWLGELPLDMAAEHGVWRKRKGNWKKAAGLSTSWKPQIRQVLEDLVRRTPGSFVEEKDYSLVWHYRNIDRELGERRVREFRDVLLYLTANLDLQVLEGNKVVEIKNTGVNKGKAALQWLQEPFDFMLAIGDDHTDEDIFEVMPEGAFTIKVGTDQSKARFHLWEVEQVRAFLLELGALD